MTGLRVPIGGPGVTGYYQHPTEDYTMAMNTAGEE
jgi:hypothetical protein